MLQDAQRLKDIAVPSIVGQGLNAVVDPELRSSWQIDADHVKIPTPQNIFHDAIHSWMALALQQSNIDVDTIGAETHFKEMRIYHSGGHYARHNFLVQEPGLKKKTNLYKFMFNFNLL